MNGQLHDKWRLLTLQAGRTRFIATRPDQATQLIKTVHRAGEYYYKTGKMQHRIFTVYVGDSERCGILYGLKKEHTNDETTAAERPAS